MRTSSSVLVLYLVAILPTFAGAQSRLGPELQFELPRGQVAISPNAEQVAIIGQFDGAIFAISDDGETWLGPFEFDGGYYSRVNGETKKKPLSEMGWVRQDDGGEVYLLDPDTKRAVTVTSGAVQYSETSGKPYAEKIDEATGRLSHPRPGMGREYFEARKSLYNEIRGTSPAQGGFVARREIKPELLPESIVGLADISPSKDRILCRTTEDSLLSILDLHTGGEIALPIQDNRPPALPGRMSGSFSPDGEFVLVQYSYGPDDHYAGGYLQLFDVEGKYVEEVAEFHKDVAHPVGFHEWLSNNWIVYSNGKELVFRKFIGE